MKGFVAAPIAKPFIGNETFDITTEKGGFAHILVRLGDVVKKDQIVATVTNAFGQVLSTVKASIGGKFCPSPQTRVVIPVRCWSGLLGGRIRAFAYKMDAQHQRLENELKSFVMLTWHSVNSPNFTSGSSRSLVKFGAEAVSVTTSQN